VDVDDSIEGPKLPAENALGELLACKSPSGSAQKSIEQRELHACQIQWRIVQPNLSRRRIETQIANNQWDSRGGNLGRPAQNGPDSRNEFARVEWLWQVIIRSDLQAKDSLDIFSTRGQNQHRNERLCAQTTQNV
jgi:hypothetical protein